MAVKLCIRDWLQGNVGVNIPDKTLSAMMFNNGIPLDACVCEVDAETMDMCLADVLWWASTLPSNKGKEEDSDGQWKHIDGGQILSDRDKANYRKEANRLRKKWNKPLFKSSTVTLVNL